MDRELAWAQGIKEVGVWMLYFESCTHSYYGGYALRGDLSDRAAPQRSRKIKKKWRPVIVRRCASRRPVWIWQLPRQTSIQKTLATSVGQDVRAAAALTYAFAGERAKAQALADDLARQFPQNTLVHSTTCLPSAPDRARRCHPDEALEFLSGRALRTRPTGASHADQPLSRLYSRTSLLDRTMARLPRRISGDS